MQVLFLTNLPRKRAILNEPPNQVQAYFVSNFSNAGIEKRRSAQRAEASYRTRGL